MFSLPKLLVLALIILVIWYGFKWINRLGSLPPRGDDALKGKSDRKGDDTIDLVKNPETGAYEPVEDKDDKV
jgi:hypothetical protein